MLLSNEETYRELSTFESVDQLNEAVRKHKNAHKLSATELALLDILSKHSCVYKGVSYLRKTSIGVLVGKHKRTVIRACKRLESLGIIEQFDMKRITGDRKQTSNAIVIQPFKQSVTREMSHQEAKKPIKLKPSNTYKETASATVKQLPTSALRHSIPKAIYDTLAPFYDLNGLYKTYGTLLRAKASIDSAITIEDNANAYVDIFMNVILKYKLGQVRNFDGLLYSAWQKVTAELSRVKASATASDTLYYDWLA